MQTLIQFILRNHYVILFLLIEALSVFMVVEYNSYQHSCFVNSSANVVGHIDNTFSSINDYLYLNQRNQELNAELAQLRNSQLVLYKTDTLSGVSVRDSVYMQQYEFLPCRVISNSVESSNNFITLDIGSKQGVEPGMGVISASGVVGVVKCVSPNYSAVISVLNQNLKVSAMLEGSGYFGSLGWDGYNYEYATIGDLPGHIRVRKDDVVITSGYSAIFPKGIMIGKIDAVLNSSANGFMSASVKLSVDFKKLSDVQVVKNLTKGELLELQNRAENE